MNENCNQEGNGPSSATGDQSVRATLYARRQDVASNSGLDLVLHNIPASGC